jgi:isoaspartyl peptidase/L-asparaginase-like protein (Ntn-hydrolase superfamily)
MDGVDRREFMKGVAGAAALSRSGGETAAPSDGGPLFLATWTQGKPANERAVEVLAAGRGLLDAVEEGIKTAEDDPKVSSVGYGGLPNEEGVVELDAAIMDGTRHRAGAVCALQQIRTPISVARLVLEKTRHTTLAGEGALRFALRMGFTPEQLLTPESLKRWQEWKADPKRERFWASPDGTHDTIGLIGTDGNGNFAAGCSTSGLAWKIFGRVGDSPLVGCGLYVDSRVGAATATGNGDLMTNYCTSVSLVHAMGRGATPQDACIELLEHIAKSTPESRGEMICVLAMNARGEIGAAAMSREHPLEYALWRAGESRMLKAVSLY